MWRVLDKNGKAKGRASEFPPIPGEGERLCYTVEIRVPRVNDSSQGKLIKADNSYSEIGTIREHVTYFSSTIRAWGDSVDSITQAVEAARQLLLGE